MLTTAATSCLCISIIYNIFFKFLPSQLKKRAHHIMYIYGTKTYNNPIHMIGFTIIAGEVRHLWATKANINVAGHGVKTVALIVFAYLCTVSSEPSISITY